MKTPVIFSAGYISLPLREPTNTGESETCNMFVEFTAENTSKIRGGLVEHFQWLYQASSIRDLLIDSL